MMDFSCYITVMNLLSVSLSLESAKADYGTYNPSTLPPEILASNQTFFALENTDMGGSEGQVTYSVQTGSQSESQITLSYRCPMIEDNMLGVPVNQSSFFVTFYGSVEPIDWNPNGSNWGPPNNCPEDEHPLYGLFVISEAQIPYDA